MELIIAGIGILLINLMWRKMLKRSLLDTHRDKLFDLRDNLRATFRKNDWDMNSPIYRHVRDLLNGYLRYTERFSYSEFNYIETAVKHNKDLQRAMKERFERNFVCDSVDQSKYIAALRHEARQIMMSYMLTSSGWMVLLIVFFLPIVVVVMLLGGFIRALKASGLSVFTKMVELREVCTSFVRLTLAFIAAAVLTEDLVEEYSYRQAAYR
ncbi:hypothetical protein GM658_12430 [Pseudoduganella eburnea]|uniref:Uncharacterized protein n=1 Tax=Massilia eburnea TaxID=1776165 RepID=A0A6L6QIE9_9BURK|nr:hypothetical protein [Massilia eburnea]MTW11403.1 hypothetical protein [Massilia eburnea]